jgi:hypothetical protein
MVFLDSRTYNFCELGYIGKHTILCDEASQMFLNPQSYVTKINKKKKKTKKIVHPI